MVQQLVEETAGNDGGIGNGTGGGEVGARIGGGTGVGIDDGARRARCECPPSAFCNGLFCPGPRAYENGFTLDSTVDDEERDRVEAAGPESLVRMLGNRNPWLLGLPDALDLLRAADRLASWVAARQAALMAQVFHQVDGHEASRTGESRPPLSFMLAAEEIAPLLRVPSGTAHRLLGEGLRLSEELPAVWDALDAGELSAVQAQVIVEQSGTLPAEALPVFEEQVLRTAAGLTRPKLGARCRRLREELHPESITARKKKAVRDRGVTVEASQDGMAWLNAYLPAEQALGIYNRVDAAARALQSPEEVRTLSQLRADVFTDVLTHTCTGDPKQGTGHRGVGARVFVTVPAMTLLGRHAAGCTGGGNRVDRARGRPDSAGLRDLCECVGIDGVSAVERCAPGLLEGYGPIDPDTARKLAGHAPSFARILTHPETGVVLGLGRDRYRPPKPLQDLVRIVNPTCIHPGCNRSSQVCEIDHTTPWAAGGCTDLCNLRPRCKLHHMLKTEGFWGDAQPESGIVQMTSLAGRTYTTFPEPPPPF
ncbi:HNH endonuclease signature motif containing protein [Arthrobacter sp. H5]|uniref:HNH endonuclease signature motif containing protein n=1 Tax=Arthrobacter sp. H5 TaxID=1267973 RepID=UPI000483F088|nr:HNH endonuclease signature motif containing protein [Arthrobacter sp. H5]